MLDGPPPAPEVKIDVKKTVAEANSCVARDLCLCHTTSIGPFSHLTAVPPSAATISTSTISAQRKSCSGLKCP